MALKHQDKDWLYQKYVVEELDAQQIANMVNRNITTIYYWMRKFDIPTRPRGSNWQTNLNQGRPTGYKHTPESIEKIGQASRDRNAVPYLKNGKHWLKTASPEDNPKWKGGITPERIALYSSEEWKQTANLVWRRDNATCQRCNKKYKYKKVKSFHIHHIVSFKIRHLRLEPGNLILLCRDCHYWVHSNENINREFIKEHNETT